MEGRSLRPAPYWHTPIPSATSAPAMVGYSQCPIFRTLGGSAAVSTNAGSTPQRGRGLLVSQRVGMQNLTMLLDTYSKALSRFRRSDGSDGSSTR